MSGPPERTEAAPYYFTYIDRITGGGSPIENRAQDAILPYKIIRVLETQLDEVGSLLAGISEERSLHRYAPDKWSLREVLNHLSDTERMMTFRAYWFARNFDTPLPSFDQNIAVAAARADDYSWATHVAEFRAVRHSTIAFFRNLPEEAWMRHGIASGNPFTVRTLAYIAAGHVAHHVAIIKDRYLI